MLQEESAWHAAASARLLEAQKRSGSRRLGSRKRRTGCTTCKARRIKCDEGKPGCERCQKAGRKCDGYASSSTSSGSISPIERSQPQFVDLKDADRRTFDYFVSRAAPLLSGTMDKVSLMKILPCQRWRLTRIRISGVTLFSNRLR